MREMFRHECTLHVKSESTKNQSRGRIPLNKGLTLASSASYHQPLFNGAAGYGGGQGLFGGRADLGADEEEVWS